MAETGRRAYATYVAPAAASAFVLVFAVVRGTKDSMWFDEAFSYAVAKRPFGALVDFLLTGEPNMGPYYLSLWGWIRIDDGDLWIRFLSALCTVVALWGVWVIVRRWSGPGPAGLAAVVFALTPFVLAWSIQARGYTMAMAFAAWSLVFADRIRTGPGRWDGVVFGALVGLGVASQFATVFVFVGVIVALVALAPTRATVRSLLMSGVAAMVVFAPFSAAAVLKPDHASWIPDLTMKWFLREIDKTMSGNVWTAAIGSGVVCLLVASLRSGRVRPYLMPLAGAVTGLFGLVFFSVVVRPLFVDRYLIAILPLVVVAAVGGWSVLWSRWRVTLTVVVVGLMVLNLGASIERTRPSREDYRSVAADVLARGEPGDAIVAYPTSSVHGLTRYLPEGTSIHRLVSSARQPGSWMIVGTDGAEERPRRLWIVIRDANPPSALRDWITKNFPYVIRQGWYGSVRLELRGAAGG